TMDAYVPGRESGTLGAQKHDRLNVFHGFGTIGEWLYRNIGGINPDTDPANAGFKHFIIRPQIGGDLTCADVSYDSVRGTIRSHWWIEEVQGPNILHLDIDVPANTTATVYVPGEDLVKVLVASSGVPSVSDSPACVSEGITSYEVFEGQEDIFAFTVESGSYHFYSLSQRLFPDGCTSLCCEQ
ncbi:MAG: hypothetical protein KC964_25995, partial [Candidatus Omnitrophica bacterium]|nr:hypothetical protein [Candidatus Omnitrophota bacterium]